MMTKKTIALFLLGTILAAPLAAQNAAESAEYPSETYEFVLAKLLADEGDHDEALKLIDRVRAKEPNNPVVIFEHANILLEAGKVNDAERELRSLTDRYPDFYDAQRLLGRLLLDQTRADRKRMDEALVHLQKALQLNPEDFSSGLTVAQLYTASNRLTEAEKTLAALSERFPDNRMINYNYAQLLTKLGKGDESKVYLERVLGADPTFVPAALQLADIYQKENEWKKGAETLAPLAEQDPMNRELQRQLAYFWFRAGESEKSATLFSELLKADPKDDKSRFFYAESLNDQQRYPEAEKIYRQLLEKEPNDAELLVSFGMNQLGQRKLAEAEKTFHTLLAQSGLPAGVVALAKTQLATIAHLQGDYDQALFLAREALRGPKGLNTSAVSLVLDVYRRQKRYQDALDFLQPLVKELGTDTAINVRYLEFLIRAGDTVKADAIAGVQIKSGTRGAIAVAQTYAQLERWDDAIRILSDLRKANPEDDSIVFQLGSAYERAGKTAEAEKIFLGILERKPDDASTLNYLGYMWADRGENLPRAEEMIAKAVKQDPRNAAYIDSLGWVYYRLGKLELAQKHLVDASDLMPWDPTIQEHLGDVYVKRGELEKAAERYRAALKLDPEQRDEAKIRTKLAEIEKKGAGQARQ